MPGAHTFFSGSKILEPVADWTGLQIDQVNFVASNYASVIGGLVFCSYGNRLSSTTRLWISLLGGLAISLFCFGTAIKHVLVDAGLCYLLLVISPPKHVHRIVLVTSMFYLCAMHLYRLLYANSYMVDITGPMMILTMKLTTLAFSLHDGMVDTSELTPLQRREIVKERPTVLEFLSYAFFFPSFIAGPLSFYSEFIRFIRKEQYWPDKDGTFDNTRKDVDYSAIPGRMKAVVGKVVVASICAILNVWAMARWPVEYSEDPSLNFFYRHWYLYFSMSCYRLRYYYAWIMSEAGAIASGFGYEGAHEKDGKNWDMLLTVDVYKVEFGPNLRAALEGWNIGTVRWLRRVGYDRAPKGYGTIFTYTLSALWHGFYPGYYITFPTAALFTVAARAVRRHVRPLFLGSTALHRVYDLVTIATTRFALAYTCHPFVLLYWAPSVNMFRLLYLYLHFLAVLAIFALPVILPVKREKKGDKGPAPSEKSPSTREPDSKKDD